MLNVAERASSVFRMAKSSMARDFISPFVRWRVGNGRQIRIKADSWLQGGLVYGPVKKDDLDFVSELVNLIC